MRVLADAPLAPLTTLRLGGPAARLVEASTEAELVASVLSAPAPVLVLGGGSNLVVADEGFAGTVVHVATRGVRVAGDSVTVAAGEPWDAFVAAMIDASRAGVEALTGIPGLVGATPIQNVGAYGQEVAQSIEAVRALDRESGAVTELAPSACRFGYRTSRFKACPGRHLVLAVTFRLPIAAESAPVRYGELARALGVPVGARAPLTAVRDAVLHLRRTKGMVLDEQDRDTWSAGSFFTNPVLSPLEFERLRARAGGPAPPHWPNGDGRMKVSAAWLIEHAGFRRGHARDGVRVSGKHTLALTHCGGGSTRELLALAREIRDGVRDRFGVVLEPEPVIVGAAL